MNKEDLVKAYCRDKSPSKQFTPAYGIYSSRNFVQFNYAQFYYTHGEPTIHPQLIENYIDGENLYKRVKNPQKLQNEIYNYCAKNNLKCNFKWMNGFRITLPSISTINRTSGSIWKDCKAIYLKHMPSINNIVSDNM